MACSLHTCTTSPFVRTLGRTCRLCQLLGHCGGCWAHLHQKCIRKYSTGMHKGVPSNAVRNTKRNL